ncbi:hypothetical protein NECAME_13930 [Necator americanus]|uniref:Uncharacterized protein n=1 Tax=Necator americanus TaxID=51031 RepID=W2SU52_NECAM|nr:hypothetical protein NECAME_13930 [Necator americanus]ETN72232.1 hypothetical protein NECAME_13930 [Necator americanus]
MDELSQVFAHVIRSADLFSFQPNSLLQYPMLSSFGRNPQMNAGCRVREAAKQCVAESLSLGYVFLGFFIYKK